MKIITCNQQLSDKREATEFSIYPIYPIYPIYVKEVSGIK